jgi:hypothetical protein
LLQYCAGTEAVELVCVLMLPQQHPHSLVVDAGQSSLSSEQQHSSLIDLRVGTPSSVSSDHSGIVANCNALLIESSALPGRASHHYHQAPCNDGSEQRV